VVLIHAYTFDAHEAAVGRIANDIGFTQVGGWGICGNRRSQQWHPAYTASERRARANAACVRVSVCVCVCRLCWVHVCVRLCVYVCVVSVCRTGPGVSVLASDANGQDGATRPHHLHRRLPHPRHQQLCVHIHLLAPVSIMPEHVCVCHLAPEPPHMTVRYQR
jgi:hypothetical protein